MVAWKWWIFKIDRSGWKGFFIIETSDSKKVKIVVMKLASQVSAWWNQNKQIREQAGKNRINSRQKLKKEMVDD